MLTCVHRRSPPSVTCAGRDGWVSADAREPRRMRPHLRPAGTAGRCQRRGPHPAACTVPILVSAPAGLFGVGPVIDATLIGSVGDVSRAAGHDRFAAYNRTAPIEVFSGSLSKRHPRLSGHNQRVTLATLLKTHRYRDK